MLNILVVEDNKYRNNAHDSVIACTIGIPTPSILTQLPVGKICWINVRLTVNPDVDMT